MTSRMLLALLAVSALPLGGCNKNSTPPMYEPLKDYSRPLPPGALALRKLTDPADYPDFSTDRYNQAALYEAIQNSLAYLAKPSSQKYFPYGDITHAAAVASLRRFGDLVQQRLSPEEINEIIRTEFDVYQSVGCDDRGTMFYTGYYCPIFDGRKTRDGRFRFPLYRLPPDLVKDGEGITQGRKMPNGSLAPYPTRRHIEESGMMAGQEIAWLADPFETYVVTVQGSAKLRMADGSLYEIGYAGNNGHEYTSVGKMMVEEGLIDKNELSLQSMMAYFKSHPQDVQRLCWANNRYVFFKESSGGPYGSINVPVIPFRSIATDKEVFPRACVAFVDTHVPHIRDGQVSVEKYGAFALDQDTGGAIRAAGRCDIFMGIGPGAEALAGRTGAEGELFYIFIKPEYMSRQAAARN